MKRPVLYSKLRTYPVRTNSHPTLYQIIAALTLSEQRIHFKHCGEPHTTLYHTKTTQPQATMNEHRTEWIIIGISGVTCGGKTSLANKLQNEIAPVYVFHQDMYFYPDDSPKHVKCKGLDHNNYDILSSLDMDQMYKDVLRTMEGEDRAQKSSAATEGKFSIAGKKFLVVEGFTVLNFKPLLELCDFRYYFVLEYGECVSRRSYRLYEPPDVAGYFDQCVWPEHVKYRAEIEKDRRVQLLDGTEPGVFDHVMADLKRISS